MEENIFELLQLDPSENEAGVRAALEKAKIKARALISRNPAAKEKYEKFERLQKALDANPSMIREHAQKYAKIMAEKRAQQEKEIRNDVAIYAVDGCIEEVRLNELANRYKTFTRDEILRITGLKIKKAKEFKYKPTGGGTFMVESVYNQIEKELQAVGKRSLYDFLNVKPNATPDQITRALEAINKENQVKPNNQQKVDVGTAISRCRTVLLTPSERLNYDYTLDNIAFKEAKERIARFATGSDKVIQASQYKALIEICTSKGIPFDKAEYLIYQCAQEKGMTIVESGMDTLVTCRFCGALNQKDAALCKTCGMPIVVTCPTCRRKSNDPEELRCTQCGFEIGDMPKSNVYIDMAEISLKNGNASQASAELETAISYWPINPKLQGIADKIRQQHNSEQQALTQVQALCAKKQYYAAKALSDKIGVSTEAAALRESIDSSINDAKTLVQKAQEAKDQNAKIDLYMQALQLCADCSEATEKLKLTPPAPPSQISAKVVGDAVRLEWTKLPLTYLEYYVVRKANGRPVNKTDGEVVCQTSNPMFDDTKVQPGVSYYYAVFSKCGDIMSQQSAVTTAPVMTVDDVNPNDIGIDVRESEITFNVKFPQHAQRIEVYRDGVLVKSLTGASFIDAGLTTNRDYSYKFVAVYVDAARQEHKSTGIVRKYRPIAPPKPVKINVSETTDSYKLTWQNAPNGTVVVYTSDKPFGILEGNKVNVDLLKFKQIDAVNNTYQLSKNFSGIKYFMPITIVGNIGVAGPTEKIICVTQPQNVKFARNNDYILVTWSWNNINAVRIKVHPEGSREQIYDIRDNADCKFKAEMPASAKSISLSVCSLIQEGNEVILSKPIEQVISLQSIKVNFSEAKCEAKFGFLGKNKFSITLMSPSFLPCDLCLLVGEDQLPIDLINHPRHLVIPANELQPNQPLKKEFEYNRMSKKSKLYFRVTPADRAFAKQVTIIPESREIK